jgi:ubiquitin-conjugating enzyme E2 variant
MRSSTLVLAVALLTAASPPTAAAPFGRRAVEPARAALATDAARLRRADPKLGHKATTARFLGRVRGRALAKDVAAVVVASERQHLDVADLAPQSKDYVRGHVRSVVDEAEWNVKLQETWLEHSGRAIERQKARQRAAGDAPSARRRTAQLVRAHRADLRVHRRLVAERDRARAMRDAILARVGKGRAQLIPQRATLFEKATTGLVVTSAGVLAAQTLVGAGLTGGAINAALVYLAYQLADLPSGLGHWTLDNYFFDGERSMLTSKVWDRGLGRTAARFLLKLGEDFQGHHDTPSAIQAWSPANAISHGGVATGPLLALAAFGGVPGVVKAVALGFFGAISAAQWGHRYAHMANKDKPAIVRWLQERKLLVSNEMHARHHLVPFPGNYTLVTGKTNRWADRTGFFRGLERLVYERMGLVPNAWRQAGGRQVMLMALGPDHPNPPTLPPEADLPGRWRESP